MATPTLTPPVAPAAAPPAAPPASTPAPAPAAPPAPVPSVPAAPAPDSGPQDAHSIIAAGMKKVNEEIAAIKAEPEAAAPVEPAAPAVAAAEPEAAATVDPAAAAAEPPKPAEAAPAADLPELDDGQAIAPSKLTEFFSAHPDLTLKDLMTNPNADPEINNFKNVLYGMARRDEQGRPVLQLIPNEAEAKELISTSGRFHDFDDSFNGIESPDTAQKFWDKLRLDFATTGEDGKKKAHPAFAHIQNQIFNASKDFLLNRAKETGTLHPVLRGMFDSVLAVLDQKAQKENNLDLRAAVDGLREALPPDSQAKGDDMTPAQKEKQRELDARDAEHKRATSERHQAAIEKAYGDAELLAAQSAWSQAEPRFIKAGFSEFELKNSAPREMAQRMDEILSANGLYTQRLAQLRSRLQRDPSEVNRKAVSDHMIQFQNLILGKLIADITRDFTSGRTQRQDARDQKRAGQVDASRSEPRGVSASPATPKKLTMDEQWAISQAEWDKKHPGDSLNSPEGIAFHMDRLLKAGL